MPSRLRWLAGLALLAFTLPLRAQQSPLDQVPGSAPIVVHLRGWERSLARMNATIKAAVPDYGALITGQIENSIAQALNGRELKGLAKEGPMFLVFTELPTGDGETPDMAVVLHVSNYVQFRDGLLKEDERKELKAEKEGYETTKIDEKKVFFLNRGDYAVMAPNDRVIKKFLDKKATTTESLGAHLDKTLAAKLLDSDLSVVVDMKAIHKQYGDQIAQGKQFLDLAIDQAQGMGNVDKAQIEQAKKIFESIFQLVEDTEKVVGAVDFRPEGMMLRVHVQVGEKSKTNAYLKKMKPAALTGMAKLPVGSMVYSNSTSGLELADGLLTSMLGLGGSGDDKASKEVEAALTELAGLKFEESFSSGDFPSGGIKVVRYAEPGKAAAAYLKWHKSLSAKSAYGGAVLKSKPEVKEDDQKAAGFTLHRVKIEYDVDKMVERFPEEQREAMKETMKKMLGDGQHFWFGTDGKTFVQVTAKEWGEAQKLLEAYVSGKSPLDGDAAFGATRNQLPAEANTMILFDAGRTAYAMGQYVGEVLKNIPLPFPLGSVKKPDGKPSFIGLAVTLQPRNGSFDLYLPAEGVKQIVGVLKPLFGDAAE